MSSDVKKLATGITFSTISLLLTLFCSKAAVMEMTHDMYTIPKFYLVHLKSKLTDFDNFWYH